MWQNGPFGLVLKFGFAEVGQLGVEPNILMVSAAVLVMEFPQSQRSLLNRVAESNLSIGKLALG